MADIHIPPEVVTAMQSVCPIFVPLRMWEAALRAGLASWPYAMGPHPVPGFTDLPAFILPLQEPRT